MIFSFDGIVSVQNILTSQVSCQDYKHEIAVWNTHGNPEARSEREFSSSFSSDGRSENFRSHENGNIFLLPAHSFIPRVKLFDRFNFRTRNSFQERPSHLERVRFPVTGR